MCVAQLDPQLGGTLKHFTWMRRTRNGAEYPDLDAPELLAEDVDDAIRLGTAIIDAAATAIETMHKF